jgi:exodeoxyribonuclease V alpha subunit
MSAEPAIQAPHTAPTLARWLSPFLLASAPPAKSTPPGADNLCQRLIDALAGGQPFINLADEPELSTWLVSFNDPDLLADMPSPFKLDDSRLFLHRYWLYWDTLRTALLNFDQELRPLPTGGIAGVCEVLDALTSQAALTLDPVQRHAALCALTRHLAIISGGPGTGKTSLVGLVLATAFQTGMLVPSQVALAAPTGKAAARLRGSLKAVFEKLGRSDGELLPAFTLHRLLKLNERSPKPGFHCDNPLPYSLLIVDEISMADLALLAKMVDALDPLTGRLILLGDQDQLAGVEVGSLFPVVQELQSKGGLAHACVNLQRNYRFAADSPIGRCCAQLRLRPDLPPVELVLQHTAASGELTRGSLPDSPRQLNDWLAHHVLPHWRPLADLAAHNAPPGTALAELDRYRLLSPYRHGAFGILNCNTILHQLCAPRGTPPGVPFNGMPVFVTHNDPGTGLFNGDTGVILKRIDGVLAAWFEKPDGSLRSVPVARLPAWQPAYALTVHQAQGSEFDHVDFMLPPAAGRPLTNGLVYTAMSRARQCITVFCDPT